MRLGLILHANRRYYSGEYVGVSELAVLSDTSWQYQLQFMYPDPFYTINMDDPDLDMLKEIDVLFYSANCLSDQTVLKFVDDIPCVFIAHLNCGQPQMTRYGREALLAEKQVLDASDLVISMDHQFIDVYRLFTNTPVFWWPLPYPADRLFAALGSEGNVKQYDILVPYSPIQTVNTERNGYVAALIGNKIIKAMRYYETMGIFSWVSEDHPDYQSSIEMLKSLGCENFEFIPRVSSEDAIRMIVKSKVFIDLDRSRAAGRWMVETGLLNIPVIASYDIPCARYIYGDIRIQDPFDTRAALDTARMIADGDWEQDWLKIAFHRAMDFSIKSARNLLEKAINVL